MFERPIPPATVTWSDLSSQDKGDILTFAINSRSAFMIAGSYAKIAHIKMIRNAFPPLSLKASKMFAEMSESYWNNI